MGISNLFMLDLCDTGNIQDPRDGRTSLMTAVIDNNEVRRLISETIIEPIDGSTEPSLH